MYEIGFSESFCASKYSLVIVRITDLHVHDITLSISLSSFSTINEHLIVPVMYSKSI